MLVDYEQDERARHGLNFKAVFFSGLLVGALFLLVPRGHPWASQSLPTHAMGRPLFSTDEAHVFFVTGVIQMALSLAYAFVVSALTYWMRTILAIISGGVVGALLYGINYLTFHFFLKDTPAATESVVALVHIGFGMISAGAYKGFAVERPEKRTEQGT